MATLGLRVPGLGLVFTGRGRFVQRQDEVLAGVLVTPGYGSGISCKLVARGGGLFGLLAIENLTDKSYRRHLSLIDEAGWNFKISVSYQS